MSLKSDYNDFITYKDRLLCDKTTKYWINQEERYIEPFQIFGNLYYVGDTWVCVHIVDTGAGLLMLDAGNCGNTALLIESIWEMGFRPEDVKWIILSHGHADHFGAVGFFRRMYGTKIYMGEPDVRMFENNPEQSVIQATGNVMESLFEVDYEIKDGDVLTAEAILDRFENKLEIKGAVYRPGIYQFGGTLNTVRQLVEKAEGLMGDAFTGRAVLHRERENLKKEVIQVDIKGIMAGTAPDVPLQRNDVLYIPSIHDLEDVGTIMVYGEVARPGEFAFADNTTLEDIIIQAGGLKESASTVRVDVSRRIKDSKGTEAVSTIGQMYSFSLKDGFVIDGEPGFVLQPYDQVYVRKSPAYQEQVNVQVTGEVLYEGDYALTEKSERLSDLIKKAGGVTPFAYIKGARLSRRINDDERKRMETVLDMAKTGKDSIDVNRLDLGDIYYVGIDLERAMLKPGSSADIVLREGDVIEIPEYNNTVRISGAVMYPNTVSFEDGKTLKYYIEQAGGYGFRAKKSKAYIVYMNGQVKRAKKGSRELIQPGCEVIVPVKEKSNWSLQNTLSIATTSASLATMIASIANILK